MSTPWIRSARWDAAFVLAPMTLPALAVLAIPGLDGELSPWHWIALVLCVDVAHVWSTLAVTYLKPGELRRRPALYGLTPLACFAVGLALHALGGPAVFWRALAYLAVFHFLRQQSEHKQRTRQGRFWRGCFGGDSRTAYLALGVAHGGPAVW